MRRTRNIEIFQATVIITLLYSLSSVWLTVAQRRQLDGLQARCLRDLLRIPHPFESRVSNKSVLEQAGVAALSEQLRKKQLVLLGRVARAPNSDLRRRLTFAPNSVMVINDVFIRKVGRPKQEWAKQLLSIASDKLGSMAAVARLVKIPGVWSSAVNEYF